LVDTIINDPFEDLGMKRKEEEEEIDQGISDPYADLGLEPPKPVTTPVPTPPPEAAPVIAPAQTAEPAEVDDPFSDFGMSRETEKGPLTVEDVISDEDRLGKIRRMMAETKDVKFATAPAEEVMEGFMTHMRWLHTNEVSTAKEAWDVYAADDEKKAIYGDAYRVYDEMGSIFSNGDAWNGLIDYGTAFVTSPSLWAGFGIGKLAGQAGTKAAANTAMSTAITASAKQIAKRSGGRVAESAVRNELRNTAAKAAAKYHIAGAVAVEAPMATMQDWWLQETRTETGVQDEYSFLQGAIATVAGGISAIPGIVNLRTSSNSSFAETAKLLDDSYKLRAKNAAKRAAPKIKSSIEQNLPEWQKLVEAGKGLPSNPALDKAISNWFFDLENEQSLFRIIVSEGAELDIDAPRWTDEIVQYAMGMGDEALEEFNTALKPLGITFGEAVERITKAASFAGETFNPISLSKQFYKDYKNISVAKRHSAKTMVENAAEEAADAAVDEKQYVGYAQSIWKKMLVSTFPTTAVNVKGWAIARGSTALADLTLAGGLLGRAGIRALIDPAGAMKDLAKVKALAANQTFAFQTMVDPFLSSEAFLALLDKAPTKVKKSVSGQIFGGVDDFGPERFGFDPASRSVRTIERVSDAAQKLSFVHLQDTLTKGMSGLTALDREARLSFGKGIQKLIEDGEAWKITDEMWDNSMKAVLRETFSEDLSKGTHALRGFAKFIQDLSAQPGVGFIIPFGKFLNNTVAFTYRHSPLAFFGIAGRVMRGKGVENLDQALARATVGTMALAYLTREQETKQEEGLQWFERRNADGSIEDVTNLFPYSLYSLSGRIIHNFARGEGMDLGLIDNLKQQIGPLDALESVAAPSFLLDFARFMADPQVPDADKAGFLGIASSALEYVGGAVGDIAAGYTRPLDIYSRSLSYVYPEMGGGMVIDRKQAEGMDRFVQGVTRYTSAFANYLLGEETEYGTRLFGAPRESALLEGPARIPNPASTVTGSTRQPNARNLNKVLGMVDKPPFRVDSFTSGIPEYDAFINREVTPFLDQRAEALLKNPRFMNAPQSLKIEMVDDMIKAARDEVLSQLEGRRIGDPEDRLMVERRNLLTRDRQARIRAKEALGITTEDHKLSLFEIEAIRRRIALEKEERERLK
jgi:hypothetical protein